MIIIGENTLDPPDPDLLEDNIDIEFQYDPNAQSELERIIKLIERNIKNGNRP